MCKAHFPLPLLTSCSTSQVSVEQKLDKFLREFKDGKMEGSLISVQTTDSLTKDERVMWRTIRKELEDVGISLAAWESNHDFIMNWFVDMVSQTWSENPSFVVLFFPSFCNLDIC